MRKERKLIKVYLATRNDLINFFEGRKAKAYTDNKSPYHIDILINEDEIVEKYWAYWMVKRND